jgi:hypothetical protein
MRRYRLNEVARLENRTIRAVQTWDNGDLHIRGWRKIGHGRGSYYVRQFDIEHGGEGNEPESDFTKSKRLKEELTAMQIKLIQQQLYEKEAEIRQNYKGELIQSVTECLSPLRDFLLKLNLTEEQLAGLNNAISEKLQALATSNTATSPAGKRES